MTENPRVGSSILSLATIQVSVLRRSPTYSTGRCFHLVSTLPTLARYAMEAHCMYNLYALIIVAAGFGVAALLSHRAVALVGRSIYPYAGCRVAFARRYRYSGTSQTHPLNLHYKEQRPHSSLGYQTPAAYAQQFAAAAGSLLQIKKLTQQLVGNRGKIKCPEAASFARRTSASVCLLPVPTGLPGTGSARDWSCEKTAHTRVVHCGVCPLNATTSSGVTVGAFAHLRNQP